MLKKTILLGTIFASLHITTSQNDQTQPIIEVIDIQTIEYVESYQASEINHDSFASSAILLSDEPYDVLLNQGQER